MAELPNLAIPLDLQEQLLPPEQLSILTFLQYPLPPIVHAADATNCTSGNARMTEVNLTALMPCLRQVIY